MNLITNFIAVCFLAAPGSFSLCETKSINHKVTAEDQYFVAFFGEKQNAGSPVGHAFIGIGKGTPMTCNLDGSETEMVGFYPAKRTEGGKSYWYGPVDGKVKSDVRTQTDLYVFKKISFADYIKVQLKIKEWNKRKYELTRQDCISFFSDIAGLFGDITLPERGEYTLPETYVARFILINKILR